MSDWLIYAISRIDFLTNFYLPMSYEKAERIRSFSTFGGEGGAELLNVGVGLCDVIFSFLKFIRFRVELF